LISLIWFVTCDKSGILLLESSISNCFEKYILNKFVLSTSSNIKLSVWRIVRNAKDKYNDDLIKQITNMNSSCKSWWNIVTQISGIKGSDMSIPPILHTDNLIFDDVERTNLFNIYFSKQFEIDDSNSNIPDLSHGISLSNR
jgi:hypothetical protein